MTLGIDLFVPCMMVTYLLGANPKAVFPIIMGSVSFLGPVANVPFIQKRRYSLRAALGVTIGGGSVCCWRRTWCGHYRSRL